MPLFHLGLEMSNRGVLADSQILAKFRTSLERGVEIKRTKFERLTERPVWVKAKTKKALKEEGAVVDLEKGLIQVVKGVNPNSSPQMTKWLYTELGLPKHYDQKSGNLTADKEAIEKICKAYGSKYPALRMLAGLKSVEKMLDFASVTLDEKGRIKTQYYVTGTETGRFSSKKTDDDEGLNLQNLPLWFRRVIMADPGKILLEGDLSQAEARIVAYLAGEEAMIEVFNDPKKSIHKLNVMKIFGIQEDKIVKDSRPTQPYGMSKKCTHGWDYMLGDRHASQITGKPVKEMARHRESYFRAYPNLLRWHQFIKDISVSTKTLITPFGRRRLFLGRPPKRTEEGVILSNEELVRKMVAWVPQSTCTEYNKRGMLRATGRLGKDFPTLPPGAEFLMETHDGWLMQCYPEDLNRCAEVMRKCTCIPLPIKDIFGKVRQLIIPMELKTGSHWGSRMKDMQ